jgi:hypothetical protein
MYRGERISCFLFEEVPQIAVGIIIGIIAINDRNLGLGISLNE